MLLDVVVRAALPLRMRQTCSEWLERRARALASTPTAAVSEPVTRGQATKGQVTRGQATSSFQPPVEKPVEEPVPLRPSFAGVAPRSVAAPRHQEEERWNELRLDLLEQQIALLSERIRRARPATPAEANGAHPATSAAPEAHSRGEAEPPHGSSMSESPGQAHSHSGVHASNDSAQQGRPATCVTRIASGGPVLAGTLAGLSLGTLLNVLEYEGCSGRLTLSRDHRYLQIVMQGGGIVSAELDGAKVTIHEGVKAVCDWESAGFEFRSEFSIAQPQSGVSPSALMLEIMSAADSQAG